MVKKSTCSRMQRRPRAVIGVEFCWQWDNSAGRFPADWDGFRGGPSHAIPSVFRGAAGLWDGPAQIERQAQGELLRAALDKGQHGAADRFGQIRPHGHDAG